MKNVFTSLLAFSLLLAGAVLLPEGTQAQEETSMILDCTNTENLLQKNYCIANYFFRRNGLPTPQCGKHPKTYGEKGWRSTKGDLIVITNRHHEQKQAYCKPFQASTNTISPRAPSPSFDQSPKAPKTNLPTQNDVKPVQIFESTEPFTCKDMLSPEAFRLKQKEELKRWDAVNSPKTLKSQSASNSSGLSLWLEANKTFRRSLDEARVEHRRQYTAACQIGGNISFSISPEFTVSLPTDSTKRMRVRGPVASRTVGHTGDSKVTSTTDWLRELVQTGGRGIARSQEYMSTRTMRETFRTTAPEGRPCSQSGKQARLACARNE